MRRSLLGLPLILTLVLGVSGCARPDAEPSAGPLTGSGWTVLLDGAAGLENFRQVGSEADWKALDGAVQATMGGADPSFLVSKGSYGDFELRVEFWASNDANSGVFLRCQDPGSITEMTCYEANIYDERPDPTYGTGGIVNLAAAPDPMPKAGGRWNTYEITADGPHLVLKLNGATTVDTEDSRLIRGPIALQWGKGTMRFRRVAIREL